jgi:hypothetical protein
MDKYFDPAYDPSLDYTPSLDLNSIVADGAFDGWNTMLQIVRMRREDKEDRERAKKLGLSDSSRTKLGRDTTWGHGHCVYEARCYSRVGSRKGIEYIAKLLICLLHLCIHTSLS